MQQNYYTSVRATRRSSKNHNIRITNLFFRIVSIEHYKGGPGAGGAFCSFYIPPSIYYSRLTGMLILQVYTRGAINLRRQSLDILKLSPRILTIFPPTLD